MAHLKTYDIFPDKWEKSMNDVDLNNARLNLKSYVANKNTELGIREVIITYIFCWEKSKDEDQEKFPIGEMNESHQVW